MLIKIGEPQRGLPAKKRHERAGFLPHQLEPVYTEENDSSWQRELCEMLTNLKKGRAIEVSFPSTKYLLRVVTAAKEWCLITGAKISIRTDKNKVFFAISQYPKESWSPFK